MQSAACGRARRRGASGRSPPRESRARRAGPPPAHRRAPVCAVVLAVGARLSGQASCSTAAVEHHVGVRASVESGLPVIAISGTSQALEHRQDGRFNSSLSPELEIASTTSAAVTMPRSPWLASAGCTNSAGVPVEASVAAILRPTWPLLPMPITTTRPRQASTAPTARAKPSPRRALAPSSAAASMSKRLRRQLQRALSIERNWGDRAIGHGTRGLLGGRF